MPTNVGYEFEKAKRKYDEARTPMEKLLALQEMKSAEPKHKGAEKLRKEISSKLAKLRREMEKAKEQAKKTAGHSINVKKEGAGQIVLVGMPSSGKSSLLKLLTGAEVQIGDYPFTTTKPEIGMMNYKNALAQLVEVPAIIEGSSHGKANGTQVLSLIRNADAIVFVVREKSELDVLKNELNQVKIKLNQQKPSIEIKHTKFKGITISGKNFLKMPEENLKAFLKTTGYMNSSVILNEEVNSLDKIAEVLDDTIAYKKCTIVELQEISGENTDELKERIFKLLDKILIYTKKPGQQPDLSKPLVVRKDSTVGDIARHLHKDFARNLKYAKIWGSSKFPGQRVSKEYKLEDEDIIEISA